MKGHITRIHEGKQQFKCAICNAQFTSKNDRKYILQQFIKEKKI